MQGSNLSIKTKKNKERSFQGDEDGGGGTPQSATSLRKERQQEYQKSPKFQQKRILQKQFKQQMDPIQAQQDKNCDTQEIDQLLSPWEQKDNMKEDFFNANYQDNEEFSVSPNKNMDIQPQKEENIEPKKFILPSHQTRAFNFPNSSTRLKHEDSRNQIPSQNQLTTQKSIINSDTSRQMIGYASLPSSSQCERQIYSHPSKLNNQKPNYSTRDIQSTSLLDKDDFSNDPIQNCNDNEEINVEIGCNLEVDDSNKKQEIQVTEQYEHNEDININEIHQNPYEDLQSHQQQVQQLSEINQVPSHQQINNKNIHSPRFIHISETNCFRGDQNMAKKQQSNLDQFTQVSKLQKIFSKQSGISNLNKKYLDKNEILSIDFIRNLPKNIQTQFKLLTSFQKQQEEGRHGVQKTFDQKNSDKFSVINKFQSKSLTQKSVHSPKYGNKNQTDSSNQLFSRQRELNEISPDKCIFIKKLENIQSKKKSVNNLVQSQIQYGNSSSATSSQDIFRIPSYQGLGGGQYNIKQKNQNSHHHQQQSNKITIQRNQQDTHSLNNNHQDLVKDILQFKKVFPSQYQSSSSSQQMKSLPSQNTPSTFQRISTLYEENHFDPLQEGSKQFDFFTARRVSKPSNLNTFRDNNSLKYFSGFSTPRISTYKQENLLLSERQSKTGSTLGMQEYINKNIKSGSIHTQQAEFERSDDHKKGMQMAFQHFQIVEDFIASKEQEQIIKKSKVNQNLVKYQQSLIQKKQKQKDQEKDIVIVQAQLQKQCTQMLKNILKDSTRKQTNTGQKNIQFFNKNYIEQQDKNNDVCHKEYLIK